MSQRIPIPIGVEFNARGNAFLAAGQSINYYPEIIDGQVVYRSSPGLSAFATLGSSAATRGMIVMGDPQTGTLVVVSGNKVYKVTTAGSVSAAIGTLDTSSGLVSMACNYTQVMIVTPSDGKGYIYTLATNTVAKITDVSYPSSDNVTYQDGYFIVVESSTEHHAWSSVNDGTTWDALDFDSSGWKSDNVKKVLSDHRDLWCFGGMSTEIKFNDGAGFSNRDGSEIELGIAAPHSADNGAGGVFWIAQNEKGQAKVIMAQGMQPSEISTPAVVEKINSWGDISDVIGNCYELNGHAFYEITSPSDDVTLCYDITESRKAGIHLWHEKKSTVSSSEGRSRAVCYANFANELLCGSRDATGKIFKLSRTVYQENSEAINSVLITKPANKDQQPLTFYDLQVLMTPGASTGTGTCTLNLSDDGGLSFGSDISLSFTLSNKEEVVKVGPLGQSRNRVFKITMSGNHNRDIFGLFCDVDKDGY
jgi:hypothetical protein